MGHLKLESIYIYPIKSIAGISIEKAVVEERGLQYDRRWMLIDENNQMITLRKFHDMALVRMEIEDEHMVLRQSVEVSGTIKIPLQIHVGKSLEASVWNDQVKLVWPQLTADQWFSDLLKTDCRLVYMPDDSPRQVDPKYVSKSMNTSLSDGYPFLLANTTSLKDVSQKSGIKPEMERFRPNLVVETQEPFEEDAWKSIVIGNISFRLVKPCARCIMVTIDQNTGKAGKEPLKSMSAYRKVNNKILFGQNAIAETYGNISVGEELKILE